MARAYGPYLHSAAGLHSAAARLRRPDLQRGLAEDLLLHRRGQGEFLELVQVLLDVRNAGAGPVRPEQRLVRDLFQSREVLQQYFGRDAADVKMHVAMAAQQE